MCVGGRALAAHSVPGIVACQATFAVHAERDECTSPHVKIATSPEHSWPAVPATGPCTYDYTYNARPLTTNFVKAIGGFVGEGPLEEPSTREVLLSSAAGDAGVFAAMLIIALATFWFTCCKGRPLPGCRGVHLLQGTEPTTLPQPQAGGSSDAGPPEAQALPKPARNVQKV